jgi:energy-coupling factor transport system permease protein
MSVGYIPGNGPLRRAHPYTPLTVALSLAILAFVLPAPWGTFILCLVAIALPLLEGVPQVLRPAALTALPFWVFLLVIHGLIRESPLTAVTFGLRITIVVIGFLTALAAVQPARLVDAALQQGMPFPLAYLFAAALQAVPRLRLRASEILEAQRCRGLKVRGSPWRRMHAIIPLAVPLILSAVSEVDERAIALETRGAGHVTRRTILHPPSNAPAERMLRWVLLVAAAAAVAFRLLP